MSTHTLQTHVEHVYAYFCISYLYEICGYLFLYLFSTKLSSISDVLQYVMNHNFPENSARVSFMCHIGLYFQLCNSVSKLKFHSEDLIMRIISISKQRSCMLIKSARHLC
ncbi:hypothetical protein KP509_37G058400 [Ceratopteris richardii]|uniref:Uncharacterized protein n=1 Tax=Ceratopteris richardii TaxID=49495 RepID=A0A8T2Q889_CERRI|nr:hypothetical protein KP509_37G058400 [Ceratopteris richardii]